MLNKCSKQVKKFYNKINIIYVCFNTLAHKGRIKIDRTLHFVVQNYVLILHVYYFVFYSNIDLSLHRAFRLLYDIDFIADLVDYTSIKHFYEFFYIVRKACNALKRNFWSAAANSFKRFSTFKKLLNF